MAHTISNTARKIHKKPLVTVSSISHGIGDNLLTMAIAQGVKEALKCNVVLQVPGWCHPWLRPFWPEEALDYEDVPGPQCFCDNAMSIVTELHRRGIPRWRYWADRFGVEATLPPLPPNLGLADIDWAQGYSWAVVIAPYSQHSNRTWPVEKWLEVEKILRNCGFVTVAIDNVPSRLQAFGRSETSNKAPGYQFTNLSPGNIIALIHGASCLIGNDSGMAHVAGFCRIPLVVISTASSDRDIMGLYQTCIGIPDQAATPELVVEAVRKQYTTHAVPGFPIREFLETLHPNDRWWGDVWSVLHSVLWDTLQGLSPTPKVVVEIGTRAGNGVWTILQAIPGCTVHTIDLPAGQYGSGGAPWAATHARSLLVGKPVTFHEADSTKLERLPVEGVDLVYVDGAHDEATAYSDIQLALRAEPQHILVDDYSSCAGTREAVKRVMIEHPRLEGRFIPSRTGLYLITPNGEG